MAQFLSLIVGILLALTVAVMAGPPDDFIRANQDAICRNVRLAHPSMAPIVVAIGDFEHVVMTCRIEGDEFYDVVTVIYPNAGAALKMRSADHPR